LILYVETHWILSVVQAEEWDAVKLLHPPGQGIPQVYLPAFCLAEAIARFRTKEREAAEFLRQIRDRQRAVNRTQHREAKVLIAALENAIQEQEQLIGVLSSEFSMLMESIFASKIILIPESLEAIRRANAYVKSLDISRGDAVVLATVLEHAAGQGTFKKAFSSGNTTDFGRGTPASKELERAGIKSFASVKGALGWLGSGAPPSEPAT
jgi:hypothetical protein